MAEFHLDSTPFKKILCHIHSSRARKKNEKHHQTHSKVQASATFKWCWKLKKKSFLSSFFSLHLWIWRWRLLIPHISLWMWPHNRTNKKAFEFSTHQHHQAEDIPFIRLGARHLSSSIGNAHDIQPHILRTAISIQSMCVCVASVYLSQNKRNLRFAWNKVFLPTNELNMNNIAF